MPIKKLSARCTVNEANGLANDLSHAYESAPELGSDGKLAGVMSMVRGQATELNHAIELQGAESDLDTKDTSRDNKTRAVFYTIQGYTYNPNPVIKAAAISLLEIFNLFGLGMLNESFVIESSKITALQGKFAESEAVANSKVLPGVDQLIADLAKDESIFEIARVAYESKVTQEKHIASASDLKKILVTTINSKLVTYIRGMVSVEEAYYGSFGELIDQLIGKINEAVDRRKISAEAAKAESK